MNFRYRILYWNFIAILIAILGSVGIFFLLYLILQETMTLPQFATTKTLLVFLLGFAISLICIFILIHAFIYRNITKHIIKPLKEIQYATEEIQKGNFDYQFHYSRFDEMGEVIRAVNGMQRHVKLYLERASRSEQQKLELITSISHDLRTPITSIIGYAEGILEKVADTPEKQTRYLMRIRSKSQDLIKIIEQLTTSAKLELNKIAFSLKKVDVVSYIEEIVEEIRLDLDTQQVDISIADESISSTVLLDGDRFKRVVLNIITNSIQYRKKEPLKIQIRVQNAGNMLVVGFHDNGMGIEEEKQPFIFQSFYRCDDSRQDAHNSGMGLSISKSIVEGHKGKIWVRSIYGEGCTMYISLPLA